MNKIQPRRVTNWKFMDERQTFMAENRKNLEALKAMQKLDQKY